MTALSNSLVNFHPKPFPFALCFAPSTRFATPVGYRTNTIVYHAGAFRFTEFIRAGIPRELHLLRDLHHLHPALVAHLKTDAP